MKKDNNSNVWKGTWFYRHGERLTLARLKKTLEVNPEAYSFYKKRQTNELFSLLLDAPALLSSMGNRHVLGCASEGSVGSWSCA